MGKDILNCSYMYKLPHTCTGMYTHAHSQWFVSIMCLTTLLRTTLKAVYVTVKKARLRVSPMKEEFEVGAEVGGVGRRK